MPPQQHGAHREGDPGLLIAMRGAPEDAEGEDKQQVSERRELNDEQRHHWPSYGFVDAPGGMGGGSIHSDTPAW